MMNKIQVPEVQKDNKRIYAHSLTKYASLSLSKYLYLIMYAISCKYDMTDKGKYSNKHRNRKWY